MDNFSFLNAAHSAYFADLYDQYLDDPDSLEPSWRAFFQGYDFGSNNNFIEDIVDGVSTLIPEDVKKERADAIMELQAGISYQLNQEKIGKNYKVLIDRIEGNYFIGRTEFDSPDVDNEVLIKKDNKTYCRIGDFVNVEIIKADHYDLYGELL